MKSVFQLGHKLLLRELSQSVSKEQLELSERKPVVDINVRHRIKSNLFKE